MEKFESVLEDTYIMLRKIEKKRDNYEENLKNMTDEEMQESEDFLSYVIMKGVAEDLEEFLNLLNSNSKPRFQHFIIRNITEQVIEYMYLMTNRELIPEYFGAAAKLDDNDDVDIKNVTKSYKNLGQNRYAARRTSVNAMAKEIGEKYTADGVMGLYDVYSIISENCHNSYFHAIIDDLTEEKMENKVFSLWLISLVIMKLLNFEKDNKE